jgi:methionyl-tRNA formyltransferase
VVGVVSQPDKPRGRGRKVSASPVKDLALAHGLPVLQPEHLKAEEFLSALRTLRPDLGVVAAYGRILPDVVLEVAPLGMINVHASLLPRHRGAAPVARAIMEGDRETGVTIMRVAPALDSGAMFAKIRREIDATETSADVERDLSQLGASLLIGVVDAMADGRAIESAQDETAATYAPRLTREDGRIDWGRPAAAIHNLVRALNRWPHAFTFLGDRRIIILEAGPSETRSGQDRAPAGTIVTTPAAIRVVTGDGAWLDIVRLQLEGGRPLIAREFLAGHRIGPGDRFTSFPTPTVP